MRTLFLILAFGFVLSAMGQDNKLRENKEYFLLGTLKHQFGDQRSKNNRDPQLVQTYNYQKTAEMLFELFRGEYDDLKISERLVKDYVIEEEVTKISTDEITVVATGPLTSDALATEISALADNGQLHFFDAAAPIVDFSTVNLDKAFFVDVLLMA